VEDSSRGQVGTQFPYLLHN